MRGGRNKHTAEAQRRNYKTQGGGRGGEGGADPKSPKGGHRTGPDTKSWVYILIKYDVFKHRQKTSIPMLIFGISSKRQLLGRSTGFGGATFRDRRGTADVNARPPFLFEHIYAPAPLSPLPHTHKEKKSVCRLSYRKYRPANSQSPTYLLRIMCAENKNIDR